MATFNGEKYLEEQIESIMKQEKVNVSLLISDDGSNDKTIEIIKKMQGKYKNISYQINPKNKKFTYNFIDLIYNCDYSQFDYFALSDQDDYWLKNKLISAIEKLDGLKAKLYCSNLSVVDENLKFLSYLEDDSIKKTNKNTYIVENICTGCTTVFNKAFMEVLRKYYPQDIYLHDYWLFLIAVFVCDFEYDFNSYILYRQHGSNLIGSNNKKSLSAYRNKWKTSKSHQSHLCSELLKGFGEYISLDDKEILNVIINYKKRFNLKLRFLFSRRFRKRKNELFRKMKVLCNKY